MQIRMLKSYYKYAAFAIALCMAQATYSMETSDAEREYKDWLKQYEEWERFYGSTPVLDAIRAGKIDLVRTMIEKERVGMQVHSYKIGGVSTTPLMEAAFHRKDDIVDLLIQHGAEMPQELAVLDYSSHPSSKNLNLRTGVEVRDLLLPKVWKHTYELFLKAGPIDVAGMRGLLRSLRGNVQLHPWLQMKDGRGNTLLHLAIIKRNWDIADFILNLDPKTANVPNNFQVTPFELGYGLYLMQDPEWNTFIANHEPTFGPAIAEAKQKWERFKKEAYQKGIEGMKVE